MKWWCTIAPLIFAFFSVVLFRVGVDVVWTQHNKLTTYHPTKATILSTSVEVEKIKTKQYVKPRIKYRYEVNGKTYVSSNVTPIGKAGSRWTERMMQKYRKEQIVEAFYDPSDPSKAFLEKKYFFWPYSYFLISMPFFGIAISMGSWVWTAWYKNITPRPKENGWFVLRPNTSIAYKLAIALVISIFWHAVGILALGHYFLGVGRDYEGQPIIWCVFYGGLGFVPLWFLIKYSFPLLRLREANVLVNKANSKLGDDIVVQLSQHFLHSVYVEKFCVSLVCEKVFRLEGGVYDRFRMTRFHEEQAVALQGKQTFRGERLDFTCTFVIPTDKQPTTPKRQSEYPRYNWNVEVVTEITGSPKYNAKFPIIVQAPENI